MKSPLGAIVPTQISSQKKLSDFEHHLEVGLWDQSRKEDAEIWAEEGSRKDGTNRGRLRCNVRLGRVWILVGV